ncbi:mitochondrial 37S ribosomal protein bS1m NDAI_0E02440 [Naumovozyma dairenensis CBS 421]|uniref:Uncharacterized protein n=1 Tax=Naumovozyma dairenensis (strain ATCC 10597 / BCRC 20456 / CBS 421 / NBRC 0211 / NRRL Y-12639) TaxID=1071378 RepID=G0WBE1_NAUDC|nr:hypothetical protein NDAI_0E02440 [Naumovozyma dairenensis CBS 421]CCD25061.1 hypothetical protein NDAI_0E02440 [Naumovozyma dairenensis CBS 421]
MSISPAPYSRISNLIRTTKLSHVPQNSRPLNPTTSHKYYPTHQIIETKPSSLYRQDWGLKASIPSKIKSRYLIFNEMDTLERLTSFEPRGDTQWIRRRFNEMGININFNTGKINPLFDTNNSAAMEADISNPLSSMLNIDAKSKAAGHETTKKLKLNDVVVAFQYLKKYRNEFKKWLLERNPEVFLGKKFSPKDMKNDALEFLQEKLASNKSSSSQLNNIPRKIVGSGGLTYSLRGRLKNSPNGIVEKNIFAGRCLNSLSNERYTLAVGGFITTVNSQRIENKLRVSNNVSIRECVVPVDVKDATLDSEGRIFIRANVIDSPNQKTVENIKSKSFSMKSIRLGSRRNPKQAPRNTSDSTRYANELLKIIKDNGR